MESVDQVENIDYLSSLIDDCIFHIFDWLPIDDLCSISETCKKFKKLSEEYFERKYATEKSVDIIERDGGVICFRQTNNYVRCFHRQIRCVNISLWEVILYEPMLDFIRQNCCKKFKKVKIHGFWSRTFTEGIIDQLQEAETVEFGVYNGVFSLNNVLNHLPKVKHLRLFYRYQFPDARRCHPMQFQLSDQNYVNLQLPIIQYPHLTLFELHIPHLSLLDQLVDFFRMNQTIQRFVCHIQSDTEWMKRIVNAVSQSTIGELIVEVTGSHGINFALIRDDLRALDERDGFTRLELSLGMDATDNLNELATMKSFAGLQLRDLVFMFHLDSPIIKAVSSLANLRILRLQTISDSDNDVLTKFAKRLSTSLVNLEELYCKGNESEIDRIERIIIPFVQNSPKLVNIFVTVPYHAGGNIFDVTKMNVERNKLKINNKLTVCVRMGNHLNQNALQNGRSDNLVQLKRMWFDSSEFFSVLFNAIN